MATGSKLISDKELYDSIVNLIKKSKKDIVISSPWIYNVNHILDELINADRKGVKIHIIMKEPKEDIDDKKYQNYKDKLIALKKLRDANANIVFDPSIHEKVVISDGKEMIVSSANLIGQSLTRNGESGMYTNNSSEIEKYQSRLERKYKKIPIKENKPIVSKQVLVIFVVAIVIVSFIAVMTLRKPNNSSYTISSILNEKPINQLVKISGLVENAPEDYLAKSSGKTYQQFYITDGSARIKVFCLKDISLTISRNNKIEAQGRFTQFSNEYQISDLDCSSIKKN